MPSRLVVATFGRESIQSHFHEIFQNVNQCHNRRRNEKFHTLVEVTLNRFQAKSGDHQSTRHDRLLSFHGLLVDFQLVYKIFCVSLTRDNSWVESGRDLNDGAFEREKDALANRYFTSLSCTLYPFGNSCWNVEWNFTFFFNWLTNWVSYRSTRLHLLFRTQKNTGLYLVPIKSY